MVGLFCPFGGSVVIGFFTEGAKALLVTFISLLINSNQFSLAQLFPALPNPHSTPLPSHYNGLLKMTPSTIGVSNGSAADKPCSLGLFYKAVKILSSSASSSCYLTTRVLSYLIPPFEVPF